MTIYDLFCISEKNKYLPFFKKIRRRLDLYREVRACYKILTISCNTKDDIIKYLHVSDERIIITPLDCDRGKIDIVLSSPINMQRFQAQTGGFDYFISVVGRLTDKRKNVPFLIRSFGRFMRRSQCLDKGLRLLIAGKFQELDSEYQDLLKIVREEHLTNNVFFLGHIDDIDLYWLLKRSKALIFTSLFEGFGIPILEAFYVSVPVITSNSSAMREIAADNSAIFVNPMDEDTLADAMAKIAFSSNDTIRLIRQGTSRLKYFDWEKSVDKIVEIYEQKFLLNN
jgi:glycosyltransferase involved in cell wall biosynthesis